MELMGELSKIAERIPVIRGQLATEEATKNALIMPFLQALGYNVFNPLEVVPKFTADACTRNGEQAPVVLVGLGKDHGSQAIANSTPRTTVVAVAATCPTSGSAASAL